MGSVTMKKGFFHRLSVGDKFWSAISSRVYFFSKDTGKMVWSPKGIRYPLVVLFVGDTQAVIKTTEGKYFLCDITAKEYREIFKYPRIRKCTQDYSPVFHPEDHVIYDIIDADLYEQYVAVLELVSEKVSLVQIPYAGRTRDLAGIFDSCFTFVQNCSCAGFKEVIVAYTGTAFKEISSVCPERSSVNILFFDGDITLFADGQLRMRHHDGEETTLSIPLPADALSLKNCLTMSSGEFLLFSYRNRVEIYDVRKKEWMPTFFYDDIYDAKIIGGELYLATFNGLQKVEIEAEIEDAE